MKLKIERKIKDLRIGFCNVNYNPLKKPTKRHLAIAEEMIDKTLDIVLWQEAFVSSKKVDQLFEKSGYIKLSKKRIKFNKFGLVAFVKQELHTLVSNKEYTKFDKQGNFYTLQASNHIANKGFQTIFFKDLNLAIINIHTSATHRIKNPENKTLISQHNQLTKYLKELCDKGYRILAMGDFNMPDKAKFSLQSYLEKGFVDITKDILYTFKKKLRKWDLIETRDRVFIFKEHLITCKNMQTLDFISKKYSDHQGLIVHINI